MITRNADPFVEGATFLGNARTVTDAEIALLPAIMGAINPLFHDEVTALESPMKGRILYGPALLGISVALTEHLLATRVIGLMEIRHLRFRRPVRSGDTVRALLTVTKVTPREGRHGLVLETDDVVTNQTGETVLRFQRSIWIKELDQPAADADSARPT